MNEILLDLKSWFGRYDLASAEGLPLIATAVSIVAILVAWRAYRRAVFPKFAGKTKSLERKVNSQESRISQEVDQFSKETHRIATEHTELRERYNLLEQKLEYIANHLKISLDQELFPEVREAAEQEAARDEEYFAKKKDLAKEEESRQSDKKISDGLRKSRNSFFSKLKGFFDSTTEVREEIYSSLEEILITSDIGVQTTEKLLLRLAEETSDFKNLNATDLLAFLKANIVEILEDQYLSDIVPAKREGKPFVLFVVGVNGVGKTTTIAKLSAKFKEQGARVLLGACDTFRAAASEQLEHWANKVGVDIVVGEENAKPATVAYKTIHRGLEEGHDVVIIDTAGRLHTKTNLMNELQSVVSIISREQEGAPHESMLVLDATTGQNALQQAREFSKVVDLNSLVVTKLDGTPKGGIVVAIKDELKIPIRFIGVGEGVDDLKKFSAQEFTDGLLGIGMEEMAKSEPSAKAKARRSRRAQG